MVLCGMEDRSSDVLRAGLDWLVCTLYPYVSELCWRNCRGVPILRRFVDLAFVAALPRYSSFFCR